MKKENHTSEQFISMLLGIDWKDILWSQEIILGLKLRLGLCQLSNSFNLKQNVVSTQDVRMFMILIVPVKHVGCLWK